jgi:hypothetical protein
LGLSAIVVGLFAEALRAFYGAAVNLTGVFGFSTLAVAFIFYGLFLCVGAWGLLWGERWGRYLGGASAVAVVAMHIVSPLAARGEIAWVELGAYAVAAAATLRYLFSPSTARLAEQPRDHLTTPIKVLHALLTGFAFLCLAAILLILFEPHITIPLNG